MNYKIYQVDAFTDRVFSGNPAAVCPLEEWLSDELMLKIAAENNLAETAFYVKDGNRFQIRWFTPKVEIDLCGHATLASAFVLFHHENHQGESIHFYSPRSGDLMVTKKGDFITLNFPADQLMPIALTDAILDCFDPKPQWAFKGKTDFMVVFDNEKQIQNLNPHLDHIARLDGRGVIATAKGDKVDFVSRFFGPKVGVNKDAVTGSAHTTLIPYWVAQLDKTDLTAIQLSERKGYLQCSLLGDRVAMSGQAKLYLMGEIFTE